MKPWKVYTLALVVLAWVLLFFADRYTHPFDLETERRAAQAEGLLEVPPEWTQPPPPESRNARNDWMQFGNPDAMTALRSAPLDDLPTAIRIGAVTPSDKAAARAFLSDHRELVSAVHRAAAKPGIYRKHTFAFDEIFPEYAVLRRGVRLLCLRGDLLALDGRFAEAVREHELGLNVSRQAAGDPIGMGFILSASTERVALLGMEDVLTLAGPNAPICEAVQSAVLRTAPERDFPKMLTGETVYMVRAMEDLGMAQFSRPTPLSLAIASSRKPPDAFARYVMTRPGQAVYLHWMVRYVRVARLPVPQRQRALAKVESAYLASKNDSPAYLLADVVLALLTQMADSDAKALAHRAVVVAAAGVLAHKARTGAYPDHLTASIAPRTDPYTGKPLGYRREGSGFIVYSAGEKGTFTASPTGSFADEVYFQYTPPSRPTQRKP